MTADLLHALQSLGQPRALVVGDLMLDRYTTGNADRVSQESPVIVLRVDQRDARLGGAANVANMLRSLQAQVTVAGVIGDDEPGRELTTLLEECGCQCDAVLVDPARPTTLKERFVGMAAARHPNQILRVDTEVTAELPAETEDTLAMRITQQMEQFDVVVISDYAKGVCSERLLRTIIHAANESHVPVLVDPQRGGDWSKYRGCTLIKPNRNETEVALGERIHSPQDALRAGAHLCWRIDADMAVITLDRDGMALVNKRAEGELFSINARRVYDITGAGDMVMAMLAAAVGSGASITEGVQLANLAAGLEVERTGAAAIPKDEIEREINARIAPGGKKIVSAEAAQAAIDERRLRGERIVFTNGCFDLLHVGHVTYLDQAKAMGDVLVVGINSDDGVRRLKGPSRPVIGQSDRAAMLAAMSSVDYVVVFDEDTPHKLLHALRPDVLVKGGTYQPHEVVGHEVVKAYGGEVRVAGMVDGISTTSIVECLRRSDSTLEHPIRRAG